MQKIVFSVNCILSHVKALDKKFLLNKIDSKSITFFR